MGLLDGLLQNVLGASAGRGQGSMIQAALQVLEQNGGLPGILSKFEHGGMADHVGSWVATGANMPITGAQLQEILGMSDRVMVMREGRTAGILDRRDANQVDLMRLAAH